MKLCDVIDSPCGLRYMFDRLELQSGLARATLLGSEMMTSPDDIAAAYGKLKEFIAAFPAPGKALRLQARLAGVKDISGTLARLAAGITLDDVALFEIKEFCIIAADAGGILSTVGIGNIAIPDLSKPLAVLDPEQHRVPSFYVYDSYSPRLRKLRKRLKTSPDYEYDSILMEALAEEEVVREKLTVRLEPYAAILREALSAIAETDIILAKALQAVKTGLSVPTIARDGRTVYRGLFHPQVKGMLAELCREFQAVDIWFGGMPETIIGANMGGKTVVLRMAALCQYLFQFGFGIPAAEAAIDIKESVVLCEDYGSAPEKGLSSFAAEVAGIDAVIKLSRRGIRGLWLIDEPARTTNPVEGAALAAALLEVMAGCAGDLIVTTHYNIGNSPGRRLKVRGMVDGRMDYSLEETDRSEVPREALAVAESMGADSEWIGRAGEIVKKQNV